MKDLIIFDLDGTLTESKSPVDTEMAGLIVRLLEKKKVAVMSGGAFPQFEKQFLSRLPHTAESFSNLFILPTSGTALFVWRGSWVEKYSETLSEAEKDQILPALDTALRGSGYVVPPKVYGQIIEDRGSQITFSALGQSAPVAEKYAWDPTREKRQAIATALQMKLPQFDVRIGGSTSIDITKRGVNKGYGIRKLEEYLKIPTEKIVFVGDALFHGGNDFPAKATGVDCIQVSGPIESKKLIEGWLANS